MICFNSTDNQEPRIAALKTAAETNRAFLALTKMFLSIIKLLSTQLSASTGVISREYGQGGSPLRGGKLHCLSVIYSTSGRETTKISPSANFSSDFDHGLITKKS
jgi:hypothetical protein